MRKKLFNIFLLTILSGCTVIGSQPILSFDSIDSDNIVIFLQDSKNAILIDTEKEKIAATYEIPVNKEMNSCYAFDSHYDFYVAGNNLYFTSENSHDNIKNAQRVFHINPKTGEYKQLPLENFSDIYSFNNKLWINIDNHSFYEYNPAEKLGIQTENVNLTFNGTYIYLNNEYYLQSGDNFVHYGSFDVIKPKSDDDKNIFNKISPNWTAPFYIENTSDTVFVKEITSFTPPIQVNESVNYTNEDLSGTSINYISENEEKNTLFIIRSGNKNMFVDKYTKNPDNQKWEESKSIPKDNIELLEKQCKETLSDFWIFAKNSGGNRVILKISKETLEIKEIK